MKFKGLVGGLAIAAAASLSASAAMAGCTGSCGTAGADGVVTLSPSGGTYQWISTNGGLAGVGSLGVGSETNGSEYSTGVFAGNVGDSLKFYFNYVTSDGSGYPDYAWSKLVTSTDTLVAYLFTARTTPSGNTSPGNGLPANSATLTPPTTPIIGGGPVWSPLGGSSGACWAAGCGYTGWIQSDYAIGAAGSYKVVFGVVNANDKLYDSGLAFDGVTIHDVPVPDDSIPEPATWAMMLIGFAGLGAMVRSTRRTKAMTAA